MCQLQGRNKAEAVTDSQSLSPPVVQPDPPEVPAEGSNIDNNHILQR